MKPRRACRGRNSWRGILSQTNADLKMLVVDHEPETLELVRKTLGGEKVQLFTFSNAEGALERLTTIRPQVVLSDLQLPDMNGLVLLERVLECDAGIDFILMADDPLTETAVDAIRKGACDYLSKPLDVGRLRSCVRRLVDEAITRQKTFRLDQDLIDIFQFQGMIGRSPLMLEVFAKIRRIAPHFDSVLVTGETGTGKDLVARA